MRPSNVLGYFFHAKVAHVKAILPMHTLSLTKLWNPYNDRIDITISLKRG